MIRPTGRTLFRRRAMTRSGASSRKVSLSEDNPFRPKQEISFFLLLKGVFGFDDTSSAWGYEEEGEAPGVRGFLAAEGPHFRRNVRAKWIKLVDVYQVLFCALHHVFDCVNGLRKN